MSAPSVRLAAIPIVFPLTAVVWLPVALAILLHDAADRAGWNRVEQIRNLVPWFVIVIALPGYLVGSWIALPSEGGDSAPQGWQHGWLSFAFVCLGTIWPTPVGSLADLEASIARMSRSAGLGALTAMRRNFFRSGRAVLGHHTTTMTCSRGHARVLPWRAPLLGVWAVGLMACFQAGERDTESPPTMGPDAGPVTPPPPVGPPPVAPAPPPAPPPPVVLPPADISSCAGAPELPIDAIMRGVEPNVGPAAFGLCWSGSSVLGYFRLRLPARTGVEIITRGEAPPIASVTDRCGAGPDGECNHFGANGFFGPDESERTHYVGNPTDETWSLIVGVWWGQDWPLAPFDIETRSAPLPAESACESARLLGAGELVPATPGGFFDACGNSDNGRFYRIEIPPMSRAIPMEGVDYLHPIGSCNCSFDGTDSFETTLENLSDEPRFALLFAETNVGFAVEPMPPSARCESAPSLSLDGEPTWVDMGFAGHPAIACDEGFSDGAHFVRVEVPASTTVVVTARFPDAGPEQGTMLWARTSCATDECAGFLHSHLGATTSELVLRAPDDAPGSWIVGVAMTALPFEDQVASLSAATSF